MIRGLLLACSVLAASSAAAQSGAMWVDASGRMMSLTFAGGSGATPAPAATEPAAMAALFKDVCVSASAHSASVGQAAASRSLSAVPAELGGKNAPKFGVWSGNGVVVSQADTFLGNKSAQCNATFYVPSLPARDAVVAAVTAALGAPPANADKAIDKKGRPAKYWSPEWAVAAPSGTPFIATAFVVKGGQFMPGDRVQLSLIAASKKGR